MAVPRIIFTHFAREESPKLALWCEHRAQVLGGTGKRLSTPSGASVVWQLISSNNREIGRGVGVHRSYAEAYAAAAAVVAGAAELEVELVNQPRAGMLGWYLTLEGAPVLICARWYAADRERRSSIALAIETLGRVELAEGARQYVDQPVPPLPVPDRRHTDRRLVDPRLSIAHAR